MYVIAEAWRVLRSVIGFAVRGRRFAAVVVILGGVVAIALAGAVSVGVPVALYPFL